MSASEPPVRPRKEAGQPVADEPLDLRLLPLAAAAWAGAWWGTLPQAGWAAVFLFVATASGWLLARSGRRAMAVAVLACLLLCAGMGMLRSHQLRDGPVGRLAQDKAVVSVTVRASADAQLHPRRGVLPETAVLRATLVVVEARGRAVHQHVPVVLRAGGDAAHELMRVPAGASVHVTGRLTAADPGAEAAAVVTVRGELRQVAAPGPVARAVNRLRGGLHGSMRDSPPQQAGLLPSLVVGDTSGLDDSLTGAFKATGLTHLTAVSGTNLTLTLVFLLGLARWLGVRGWWVRLVGLGGVVVFVLVCRAEPSVLRAAAMGLVAMAGLGLAGGQGRGLRHLCVAVWVLVMVDPWLARSVGFALSTLATLGILWWGRRWTTAMAWAPAWLAESIAIPLAAQLATQPVVTSISGSISMVGLVANALAAPFVGPATILGLVTALLALFWPGAGVLLGWLAGWSVQPLIWIATTLGGLPAATWRWPTSPAMLLLLGLGCLGLAVLVPRVLASRVLLGVLAMALVCCCFRQPHPLGWPGRWQLAFCDVGQGDATVLRAGADGAAVVVDVGPDAEHTVRCLRALGISSISLLVLTHYHDDHIGGLAGVLDTFPVGSLLVNPVTSPAAGARRVAQLAAAHGVQTAQARIGDAFTSGQVQWVTVGVGASAVLASAADGESSAENDSSIVGVAQVGDLRVVIGGDVEPAGQQRIVEAGWHPAVQVLKMPHHGSSRQDERFWCDSGAALAVASAGYRNDYGHPAPAALRLAGRCGMRVARTDLEGTVTLWLEDGHLEVRSEREGPP